MTASEVKPTERHRRVSNQVWQATIAADVPAGSANGPTQSVGLSESRLAQTPARSEFIRKIDRRTSSGSEVSRPTPYQAAHVTGTCPAASAPWPVSPRAGPWTEGRQPGSAVRGHAFRSGGEPSC